MKILLIKYNKRFRKNGFTMIEVMLSVVIVAIAFSGIFLFVSNMVKFLEKTRKYSDAVFFTPPIFFSSSVLLFPDKTENYNNRLCLYNLSTKLDENYVAHFNSLFITNSKDNSNFYSNFFYKKEENDLKEKGRSSE